MAVWPCGDVPSGCVWLHTWPNGCMAAAMCRMEYGVRCVVVGPLQGPYGPIRTYGRTVAQPCAVQYVACGVWHLANDPVTQVWRMACGTWRMVHDTWSMAHAHDHGISSLSLIDGERRHTHTHTHTYYTYARTRTRAHTHILTNSHVQWCSH